MSRIADRKKTELRTKHASLEQDFAYWTGLTEKGLGLHTSQLAGLLGAKTGALSELAKALARDIARLDKLTASELLQKARPIEEMLLALHCLWGFFREKLAQRLDQATRPFLDAADELAWRCYRPALDVIGQKREPPLVFLNGGLSPFMVSRGTRWNPEGVPGDLVSDPAFVRVLQSLPIPIIGVPYAQVTHLPDVIFVAHEAGHAVEDDFKLTDKLQDALAAKLKDSPNLESWQNWLGEIFADAWAIANTGPAYVGALQDFLAPDHERPGDNLYPPVPLRLRLARAVAKQMGFAKESEDLATQWTEEGLSDAAFPEDAEMLAVASVLLETPLLNSTNTNALGGYDQKRHGDVFKAADKAMQQMAIPGTDARTLFAALRRCYEQSPDAFDPQFEDSSQPRLAKPQTLHGSFLAKLKPSDNVRSQRSGNSTPPDLYSQLRDIWEKRG